MNILFINTSRNWGGNEKWTRMAAHELAKKHNVFLAYRSENLGRRFFIKKKKFLFLNRLDMLTLFSLTRFIRQENIGVVVSTNRKYYLLGAAASRLAGCRHFVRCGIIWDVPDNAFYRLLFTRLIHGIIVNANPIRTRLSQKSFIQEEKIYLVYNGLDMDKLDQGRELATSKPFAFTVATSGELTPRKGHKELIKGFAWFVDRYKVTEAGLVLMGSGRQKEGLENLAANLGIADQVFFTGFLDNPYPLLSRSDLYVTLSSNEGISNSLLEAMYLKVPVLTSPAGGVKDFIVHGHNGLLTDHCPSKDLAQQLNDFYKTNRDERLTMARAGRQTAKNMFSLEKMTDSLETAFIKNPDTGSKDNVPGQ